jgi:hypothetical protein
LFCSVKSVTINLYNIYNRTVQTIIILKETK